MHFLVIFLTLFFSISAPLLAAEEKDLTDEELIETKPELIGVLRGFVWGLPPTVILEHEKAIFLGEENGSLFYKDYVRDMQVTIAYEFFDNKFWRAKTFIEKEYSKPQDRIEDLIKVRSDLTKRFGEPVSEEFKWLKDTEKGYPHYWGWAVFRSELFITIKWRNKETEITAYLGAKEYLQPEFNITYVDLEADKVMRMQKRKNLLQVP